MGGILAISDAASLALHTAGLLAADPARRRPARELAATLGVSQAHLAKVLQRLARAGLVHSVRGPAGGFVLRRPAGEVTLLEVYEAVMGPLRPSPCLLGRPTCSASGCVLGDLLRRVDADVRAYLSGTRLSALAALRLDGAPGREFRSPVDREVAPAPSLRRPSGRTAAPEQQVRPARTRR
ncbi:MAG: Rrf2 family transcriptional regulator [Myxococcales bacterium]|nr:Rrf2 family transcriptional regulator [Myxococcales bacterium]